LIPDLPGVRHSFLEVNGFRAHVAEAGDPDAPPIVLLHGWPQHWWCWRKVIPALAERHRVVCPDLRGHGWSDAPAGGYDKPQLASDLIAAMDALGLDRVRLVGHDWGGLVGFLACLWRPERFERLLALGVTPPWGSRDPRSALEIWRLWYQLPLTLPGIAPLLVAKPGFIRMFLRGGTTARDAMTPADVDLYANVIAKRPHVTTGVYRSFLPREALAIATGRWAGPFTVPARVLVGDHEPVARPRLIDGVPVEVLPGVGHFVPEEAPEAVLRYA
jgi:pimeloyl-ACP methyl ester carboxylesterase